MTRHLRVLKMRPRPGISPLVRETTAKLARLPRPAQEWVSGIVTALDRLWHDPNAATRTHVANIGKPVITIDGDDREGA